MLKTQEILESIQEFQILKLSKLVKLKPSVIFKDSKHIFDRLINK